MDAWEVFIKDHHEGYISWVEYERNQALLAGNNYGRVGDTKSGRGGRALLAGLVCCARCGRRLSVLYTGRYPRPIYRCEEPNVQLGQRRCLSVAGKRVDETIAAEMLRAVAPMAIEAAEEAERMLTDEDQDRRRIADLELQQAQYDASLAERRYAACDPDNRLIAAQLEKAWENALQRVERCREQLDRTKTTKADEARPDLTGLPTGQGKTWTARRVGSLRQVRGIHGYRSAEENSEWLTLSEAANYLGVSHHQIRKLIKVGILKSEQIMPDAPHQIRVADLQEERVAVALKRKGRPCRADSKNQTSMFPAT